MTPAQNISDHLRRASARDFARPGQRKRRQHWPPWPRSRARRQRSTALDDPSMAHHAPAMGRPVDDTTIAAELKSP